jgi:hypothetical protein
LAAALPGGGTYQQRGNCLERAAVVTTDILLLRVPVGLAVSGVHRITRRWIHGIEIRFFLRRQVGMGNPSGAEQL